MFGKHFILVNPTNTSRRCSHCSHTEKGNRNGKIFHCLKCGHKLDADDFNASINRKEDGRSLLACGEIELSNSLKQELEKTLLV